MSSKISIVIAIELGLLVAVLVWLAAFGLPVAKPAVAAEAAEPVVESLAVIAPIDARLAAAEEEVDRLTRRVEDLEEPVPAAAQDVEPVYTESTARREYAESAGDVADYAQVSNEPVATVSASFVQPVVEIVEYPQPAQIIIISNQRVLDRRHRPRLCQNGGEVVTQPRPPERSEPRVGGGRVVRRPKPGPRTVDPTPRPSSKPMTSRPRQLAANQQTR